MTELGSAARLRVLGRTGLEAVADETFDRFARMVRAVLGVPVALVSLVDADRQFFPGACGLGDPWEQSRETPLSHSFCQHVVTTAEPLVVVDARTDPRVRGNLAIEDLGVIGYAGMPLTDADGEVLGSLCAIDHQPRRWTAAELALLADLAAACSDSLRLRIAADLARRQEKQVEAAFDRSQLLLQASTALAGASSLEGVVATIRELATGTLDPAYVGLSLVDQSAQVSVATARHLPPAVAAQWQQYPSGTATASAIAVRTGRPVVAPDLAAVAELTPDSHGLFEDMGWQSAAGFPLLGTDGPIGALTFVWKQPHSPGDAERAVLAALAGYVVQALDRIRVLEDRRTAASIMQKALLTPLPTHPQITLAARYAPAHHEDHVGGDWYDAIALDAGRLALVIGDVAGHSIAAAATMSQYRSMLRTLLIDRQEPPSALLRRLETTRRSLDEPSLATVLVAYLDPDPAGGHTLTWANAGHPPPTLLLPDGRAELLEGRDPMLGAARRISRRNHTRHLPPGATLLLHTDGLVETRAAGFDDGVARLHALIAGHGGTAPADLADLLLRHAVGATAREDDIAVLVVAMPGPLRTPFSRDVDSATLRSTARQALTGWQPPDLLDDTLVVITELVHNAVRHTGEGGELVITRRADGVLVEVSDRSPDQPQPLPPDRRRVGGRGLLLVAALAAEWASRPAATGKVVWARMPATSPGS
jgi:serine phosphatase RsbU (regulator of sigma subunit)/anti-sigma regulatory factor (Ser/Thr protein kinase)